MPDTNFTSSQELILLDNLLWIGHEVLNLKNYVSDRWEQLQKPPEQYSETLARLIAQHENLEPAQVWVLNSRWEALQLITQYLGPQRGLVLNPSPIEYTEFLQKGRIKVEYTENIFPFTQFTGVQCCIISNPNVWNGQLFYSDELEELFSGNPHCIFVIDERAMPFTEYPDSLGPQTADIKNLLLLRSVEDRYGLPGIGFSYALGHPKLLKNLKDLQNPHSVSGFAQLIGTGIFQEPNQPSIDLGFNLAQRKSLEKNLKSLPGLSTFSSYTHYLGLVIKELPAQELAKYLEDAAQIKVYWEGQADLGTEEIIRIRAGEIKTQEKLQKALQTFIETRATQ